MEVHFDSSNYNFINFKIVMETDRIGPQVEVLNWGKVNFNSIGPKLTKVEFCLHIKEVVCT